MLSKKTGFLAAGIVVVLLTVYISIGFGGKYTYYGDSACFSKKIVHERWFNVTPWYRLPLGKEVTVKRSRARQELPIFADTEPSLAGVSQNRLYGMLTRPLDPTETDPREVALYEDTDLYSWIPFGDGNIWIYYYSFNDDFHEFIQERFTSEADQRWLREELFFVHFDDEGVPDVRNVPFSVNGQPRNMGMIFWQPEAFDQRWIEVLNWNGALHPTAQWNP